MSNSMKLIWSSTFRRTYIGSRTSRAPISRKFQEMSVKLFILDSTRGGILFPSLFQFKIYDVATNYHHLSPTSYKISEDEYSQGSITILLD